MFFSLFKRTRPPKYKEVVKHSYRIVGADCTVKTLIHFLDTWVDREMEYNINAHPTICMDREYRKGDWYGFAVEVSLSAKEYLDHKKDLEEYVCDKAREQSDYKRILADCIAKNANGRNYEVEDHLPLDDVQSVDVKYERFEWKEYVPINY